MNSPRERHSDGEDVLAGTFEQSVLLMPVASAGRSQNTFVTVACQRDVKGAVAVLYGPLDGHVSSRIVPDLASFHSVRRDEPRCVLLALVRESQALDGQ